MVLVSRASGCLFGHPNPSKETLRTPIFLCGISKDLNLKLIIEFFHLHIIPMTLFNDIMPYFDEFIHVYGWNMSILCMWSPKKFGCSKILRLPILGTQFLNPGYTVVRPCLLLNSPHEYRWDKTPQWSDYRLGSGQHIHSKHKDSKILINHLNHLHSSHWVFSDEYSYASVSVIFQGFSHFLLAKLATSSIRATQSILKCWCL